MSTKQVIAERRVFLNPPPPFECIKILDFKAKVYAVVALSESRFAIGGNAKPDGQVHIDIWHINGKLLNSLIQSESVHCLNSLDQGTSLIAGGFYDQHNSIGYFNIWKLKHIPPDSESYKTEGGNVWATAIHPNNQLIAVGTSDGITFLDRIQHSQVFHKTDIGAYSLTFFENGNKLASGGYKKIQIWTIPEFEHVHTYNGHDLSVWALTMLPNGLLVSGSEDSTIKIWDTSKPEDQALIKTISKVHSGGVSTLAIWSEKFLVSGSFDGTFVVWNLETDQYWRSPVSDTAPIKSIAFCDEKIITGFSGTTIVKIWEQQQF